MKQLFSSGFGLIALYASACIAIYALQLSSATGLVLMFFFAPLWIGALIHLLMVHLTVAAAGRYIARVW